MAPNGQPPERKCATCRKRRTHYDGQPGIECSACRKYQRLCSYATPNDSSPVHPLTLLTKSFLDGTKAFYQLGALISCFVPSDVRRAAVDTNNRNPLPLASSQHTLFSPTTEKYQTNTTHQKPLNQPSTMARTKPSRKPSATNSNDFKTLTNKHSTIKHEPNTTDTDTSKTLPYKQEPSPSNTTATKITHPKPHLTIQERLQDQSLLHWHQPIDEALDLHLHGLLTVTGKIFTPNSWAKWPKNYCRAMIQLVQLVSPAQANELLTAKMAAIGMLDREIGTQPRVIWEVVKDAKKHIGLLDGISTVEKKKKEKKKKA